MLTAVFIVLGYLVIGGILGGIINVIYDDMGFGVLCGIIWPLSVLELILTGIVAATSKIAHLIMKENEGK